MEYYENENGYKRSQIAVFSPKNYLRLGSEQDIEGFKGFVSEKIK